jgi:hypothetical protein
MRGRGYPWYSQPGSQPSHTSSTSLSLELESLFSSFPYTVHRNTVVAGDRTEMASFWNMSVGSHLDFRWYSEHFFYSWKQYHLYLYLVVVGYVGCHYNLLLNYSSIQK